MELNKSTYHVPVLLNECIEGLNIKPNGTYVDVTFGGGVNAFSRYENGKTKPPLALVKLLKVLDRHPDLLSEVRGA